MPPSKPESGNSRIRRSGVVPAVAVTALFGIAMAGCGGDEAPVAGDEAPAAESTPAAGAGPNPLRNVYFGDLHTHTTLSYDAFLNGNPARGRTTPTGTPRASP